MEKTKVSHHPYATRHSKVAKIESITEQTKPYASLSKAAKGDSPASTAKFCMISGYASPPCRPIISSSQTNDHEIEWDLTSPSARKFQQVLLSDKKTSTPNRTPTRGELPKKRELRPRLVLCKKNIALSTSGEVGSDLVDELAALNDLVNTEQANQSTGVMTPPPSVKGRAINDSCNKSFMSDTEVSSKPNELNASDLFGDDSIFSESLLLCTQALEQEAIGGKNLNTSSTAQPSVVISGRSSPLAPPSPESNRRAVRKTFDIDEEPDEVKSGSTIIKSATGTVAFQKPAVACRNPSSLPSSSGSSFSIEVLKGPSNLPRSTQSTTGETFLTPLGIVAKPKCASSRPNPSPKRKVGSSSHSRPLQPIPQSKGSSSTIPPKALQPPPPAPNSSIGIRRLPPESAPPSFASKTTTNKVASSCAAPVDLLWDDDDGDFLCAAVDLEKVESQCVQQKGCDNADLEADDDIFFQPEVMAFISQVESQCATQKSTAELIEEKRQAAIRKRQERMINRR